MQTKLFTFILLALVICQLGQCQDKCDPDDLFCQMATEVPPEVPPVVVPPKPEVPVDPCELLTESLDRLICNTTAPAEEKLVAATALANDESLPADDRAAAKAYATQLSANVTKAAVETDPKAEMKQNKCDIAKYKIDKKIYAGTDIGKSMDSAARVANGSMKVLNYAMEVRKQKQLARLGCAEAKLDKNWDKKFKQTVPTPSEVAIMKADRKRTEIWSTMDKMLTALIEAMRNGTMSSEVFSADHCDKSKYLAFQVCTTQPVSPHFTDEAIDRIMDLCPAVAKSASDHAQKMLAECALFSTAQLDKEGARQAAVIAHKMRSLQQKQASELLLVSKRAAITIKILKAKANAEVSTLAAELKNTISRINSNLKRTIKKRQDTLNYELKMAEDQQAKDMARKKYGKRVASARRRAEAKKAEKAWANTEKVAKKLAESLVAKQEQKDKQREALAEATSKEAKESLSDKLKSKNLANAELKLKGEIDEIELEKANQKAKTEYNRELEKARRASVSRVCEDYKKNDCLAYKRSCREEGRKYQRNYGGGAKYCELCTARPVVAMCEILAN